MVLSVPVDLGASVQTEGRTEHFEGVPDVGVSQLYVGNHGVVAGEGDLVWRLIRIEIGGTRDGLHEGEFVERAEIDLRVPDHESIFAIHLCHFLVDHVLRETSPRGLLEEHVQGFADVISMSEHL